MSRRIKGITIEIDGETRGLDKALRDVSQRSREITNELRDVDRLLKFNPGNVELVAQKQKLLAEQVKVTRERLDRLKASQDQVTEAFKRGEISEEQYRAFQREIIETESRLKHFESQLNSTKTKLEQFGDSAGKAGEKMKSIGDKITSVGRDLSMKVTAPLAAIGGTAVKTGIDFEQSMSKVQALSGATAGEMQKLEKQARELGKTTIFSASQAADAQAFLAMAGYEVNQILESMPGLLDLAAAAQMDLGRAADITTNIMSSFGIEAERTGHVADVLAKASASANTNVEQMGEAIKYLGPVAASLGWDLEQSAAAVMSLSNAGIQGSMAGQAFASSLARLAKPTKQMQDVMDELNISFFDAKGNMKSMPEVIAELEKGLRGMTAEQKSAVLSTLFGAEAYKHWAVLLEEGSETLAKNTQMLIEADGAAKQMADTMSDNLAGKLNQMKSAFQEVALTIYENISPAIEKLVEFLSRLAVWFGELPSAVQNVILIFAALAAALGPVLIVVGMMAQGLGSILTFISSVTTFLPKLGAAFTALTGPVGIVAAAIAALIAIGVALYKNWDEIKEFASKIWEGIKEIFVTVVTAIGEFLMGKWNLIRDGIVTIWENIKEFFSNIWNSIKNFFDRTIGDIVRNVIGKFKELYTNIRDRLEEVFKTIKDIWDKVKNFLQNIDLKEIGKDIIRGLIDGIVSMGKELIDRAKGVVNDAITAAKNLLGIASPSKVFMEIGEDTGKGLEIGLRKMSARVEKASEDMVAHAIIEKELNLIGDARGALVSAGGGGDIIINIENMNVRNDDDINKLSRELQRSIGRAKRGRGGGI